jgi:Tfp pilus assembly protein FimV
MVHARGELLYPSGMNIEPARRARPLVKAAAILQLKLLLDAVRDIALSPLALAAALLDLALLHWRRPQYFRAVLRIGEHTDSWIDLWAGARDAPSPSRENVDALLDRVEELVRDPQTGARKARVLKRWAERQVARARQRAVLQLSAGVGAVNAAPRKPDSRA